MTSLAQKTASKVNLWKIPILGPLTFMGWTFDAKRKLRWLDSHLKYLDHHIEIGSGPGSVLSVMRKRNYYVDGLDIADNGYREDLSPIVYGGQTMPFSDKAYDAALLLTVLHHTEDPDAVLREASRIAKKIVIIEDVYNNRLMEILTKAFDSLMNLEFFGHPHSNRTDAEWRQSFEALNLNITHSAIYRVGGIFKQAVYVLNVKQAS